MAYEFLQRLFGEPKEGEQPRAMTFAELEAAIEADKSLKLVDLSAGGYVAKDKFDSKVSELAGVRQQLTDANTAIKSYQEMDIDGIKQSAADWERKYTADTQALQEQIAAQARAHAEEMFLSGYKFTSTAARNGVLAELRSKQFQLDDSGTFLGAKEFMESLMKQDDYKGAFVTEEPSGGDQGQSERLPRFAGPTNGGAQGSGNGIDNPFVGAFHFNYVQQPPAHN